MMQPGFATMLCFVQTDAEIADPEAELRRAVAASFERITSTARCRPTTPSCSRRPAAAGAPLPEALLDAVLLQLALEIVADGEGATRVGRIEAREAAETAEAERVARAIANSPLVQDGAVRPRPELGPDRTGGGNGARGRGARGARAPADIDADELGREEAEAEIAIRLGRGDRAAPTCTSQTSTTSTSGSTRSTRPRNAGHVLRSRIESMVRGYSADL